MRYNEISLQGNSVCRLENSDMWFGQDVNRVKPIDDPAPQLERRLGRQRIVGEDVMRGPQQPRAGTVREFLYRRDCFRQAPPRIVLRLSARKQGREPMGVKNNLPGPGNLREFRKLGNPMDSKAVLGSPAVEKRLIFVHLGARPADEQARAAAF